MVNQSADAPQGARGAAFVRGCSEVQTFPTGVGSCIPNAPLLSVKNKHKHIYILFQIQVTEEITEQGMDQGDCYIAKGAFPSKQTLCTFKENNYIFIQRGLSSKSKSRKVFTTMIVTW